MRQKREAKLQIKFGHWLKAVYLERYAAGAFELKSVPEGDESLPFAAVKEHQVAALVAVKHGKFYYKIPDDSIGQKPYDCFAMSGIDAYVVVEFCGKDRGVVMIGIDEWVKEVKRSERKSLTWKRAILIGDKVW